MSDVLTVSRVVPVSRAVLERDPGSLLAQVRATVRGHCPPRGHHFPTTKVDVARRGDLDRVYARCLHCGRMFDLAALPLP